MLPQNIHKLIFLADPWSSQKNAWGEGERDQYWGAGKAELLGGQMPPPPPKKGLNGTPDM